MGLLAAVTDYHQKGAAEQVTKQMGLSVAQALSSFNTHGFYSTPAEVVMTQMIIPKVQSEVQASYTDEVGQFQKQTGAQQARVGLQATRRLLPAVTYGSDGQPGPHSLACAC